jgi:glycosyltransferase involved in cell wall biosynthesis
MPVGDVLVCHPGRQHSHQLALGLHEHGRLAGYLAGLPAWWRPLPPALASADVRTFPIAPVSRRIGAGLGGDAAVRAEYWGYRAFDRWCAREVRRRALRAVVCYENAALETFRAARAAGIRCILDAASVHHALQDMRWPPTESAPLHRSITAAKDEELGLADAVLACSAMAGRSYVEAGVPAGRVHALHLGVDICQFQPLPRRERATSVHFAFVGAARRLKGFDLLLEALADVRAAYPDTTLGVFGDARACPSASGVEYHGQLDHPRLALELALCDCLVLPSRFDSFGLVVLEAMACGLPVIVSDGAGAAECVDEATGWIVPMGDRDALASAMRRCIERRAELPALGAAARLVAEQNDWSVYRERATRLIESLLH